MIDTDTFAQAVTAAVTVKLESNQKPKSLLAHEKLPFGLVVICLVDLLPRFPSQLQLIAMLSSGGVMAPLMNPIEVGLLVNLMPVTVQPAGGAVTPACVTCTDWPPTAMFPIRGEEGGFALAIKFINPLPMLLPVPTVSHNESDTAAQAQLGAEAVKLILPAPPAAGMALAADSVYEHAASCMKFVD